MTIDTFEVQYYYEKFSVRPISGSFHASPARIAASLIFSEIDYDIYRCFQAFLKLNSGSFVTIKVLEVQYSLGVVLVRPISGSFPASHARIAASFIFSEIDYDIHRCFEVKFWIFCDN